MEIGRVEDLETPAFLVDLTKVERNIKAMETLASTLGVSLRPMLKTHKSVEVARLQCAGAKGRAVVSTVSEAEMAVEAGFRDILLGFPVTTKKLTALFTRVQSAAKRCEVEIPRLSVLVDHPEHVRIAYDVATLYSAERIGAFIKVDTGYHRAGVQSNVDIAELAERLSHPGSRVYLAGLYSHSGHAYASAEAAERVWKEDALYLERIVEQLGTFGRKFHCISVGSTPALAKTKEKGVITEIHPGNSVYYDYMQVCLGSCSVDDVAVRVLATITSAYADRREILLDCGALALSKDQVKSCSSELCADPLLYRVPPGCNTDHPWGIIEGHPELTIVKLSQEHAVVRITDDSVPIETYELGTTLKCVCNVLLRHESHVTEQSGYLLYMQMHKM